jgi:aspartyl-tRNA(Asn)/glutamyl-tRNA(Gln) amidotransferase subunit C
VNLSSEDIKNLSKMAALDLSSEDIERLSELTNQVLNWFNQLDSIELGEVPIMFHPPDLKNRFHPPNEKRTLPQEKALDQVPHKDDKRVRSPPIL